MYPLADNSEPTVVPLIFWKPRRHAKLSKVGVFALCSDKSRNPERFHTGPNIGSWESSREHHRQPS